MRVLFAYHQLNPRNLLIVYLGSINFRGYCIPVNIQQPHASLLQQLGGSAAGTAVGVDIMGAMGSLIQYRIHP